MLATISYFITVSSYLFPNFPADVPMGFGTFPVLGKTTTDKLILAKMGMLLRLSILLTKTHVNQGEVACGIPN